MSYYDVRTIRVMYGISAIRTGKKWIWFGLMSYVWYKSDRSKKNDALIIYIVVYIFRKNKP